MHQGELAISQSRDQPLYWMPNHTSIRRCFCVSLSSLNF